MITEFRRLPLKRVSVYYHGAVVRNLYFTREVCFGNYSSHIHLRKTSLKTILTAKFAKIQKKKEA